MRRAPLFAMLVSLFVLAVPSMQGVRADDIDIYTNPTAPSATPVVMFTLDWNPNLGSTVCQNGCPFFTGQGYNDANGNYHQYLYLNSSGTATFFDMLRASLKYVVQAVGSSGVRIGLGISHNQGGGKSCAGPQPSGSTCTNGGYLLMGGTPMATQAARDAFFAKLDAIPVPQGNTSVPYQGKELFFELFRYFSGQGWYNMENGWTDYGTSSTYNINNPNDYTPANSAIPLSWDNSIVNSANYISPVTNTCVKLYTVNIMFQTSTHDGDSDAAITASGSSGGMAGINLSGNNNSFTTVIAWMYNNNVAPQSIVSSSNTKINVTSYFIVDPSKVNTTTEGYAGAGVGVSSAMPYTLSTDPATMVNTIIKIFRNILSTSTSFVAPSVAVNVYNRSQVMKDVYIAMFQADPNDYPAWPGDIKKYALGTNATTGDIEIQDVTGANAVNPTDGRIKFAALSYWTLPADLPAAPPPPAITDIISGDDGRVVHRGGAGSKIPGFELYCTSSTDTSCWPGHYSPGLVNPSGNTTNTATRKVFYDDPTSLTGLSPFNADTATATKLLNLPFNPLSADAVGTCTSSDTDPISACNLITFARGAVYYTNTSTNTTSLVGRNWTGPWIMGDVLHSHPLAVNYGARGAGSGYTSTNPDVRIIAGTNDGFLHMFRNTKAGQTDETVPNDQDGVETWAFLPQEMFPLVNTLATNQTNVMTPPHPYGLDGTPTAYMIDVNGDGNIDPTSCTTISGTQYCDKVLLFFGLRRGGSAYYAMDITDPDNPKFLWKITPFTNSSGQASTDFQEMGESWSAPQVGQMLFDGQNVSRPVLIFGGGYDENKDTHPPHINPLTNQPYTSTAIGTNDTYGTAIYIVDAQTGALVWKAVGPSSPSSGTAGYNATTRTYTQPLMVDSIPSDVTIVDSDGNGLIDRIYVGDTGGVLWRVDTVCNNQAGTGCGTGPWQVTPVLSVGRHIYGQSLLPDDRRFFYPPAYAQRLDTNKQPYDAVVIGAGDRENPKDMSVTNWVYMFEDRHTTSGNPQTTTNVDTDLTDVTCDGTTAALGQCATVGQHGWRMRLECPPNDPTACGEKALSSPLVLGNNLIFSTYIPPVQNSTSCTPPEGSGLLYQVDLATANAVEDFDPTNDTSSQTLFKSDRYRQLASGGIPSSPVALGGKDYLAPDLKDGKANVSTGYPAYWYIKGK